ncbi:hypothetical protein TPA0908_27830 [Micromonospora sp. AKA38]|nr:hypothetical protein TPA0908_27830 [Micromonospora sp. AKA38]
MTVMAGQGTPAIVLPTRRKIAHRALPTVVDASALAHPTVYVSAGRRGLQVQLAPGDLVALTGAVTAPIAAG